MNVAQMLNEIDAVQEVRHPHHREVQRRRLQPPVHIAERRIGEDARQAVVHGNLREVLGEVPEAPFQMWMSEDDRKPDPEHAIAHQPVKPMPRPRRLQQRQLNLHQRKRQPLILGPLPSHDRHQAHHRAIRRERRYPPRQRRPNPLPHTAAILPPSTVA